MIITVMIQVIITQTTWVEEAQQSSSQMNHFGGFNITKGLLPTMYKLNSF